MLKNMAVSLPVRATGSQAAVNVTDASTTIIAANPTRNYLLIQNNSDTDIWINLTGGTASTSNSSSFKVASAGGSLELRSWVTVSAVTGIHTSSGNTKVLTVLEG